MGKKKKSYIYEDDDFKQEKCISLAFVCDERICDGYYFANSVKMFNKYLKKPELLEENIKKVEDIFGLLTKYKNFASTLTRTSENYQPNTQIIAMMNSNANVLQEAKDKLSTTARQNIENSLSTYKSQQGDDYSNVVSGAQASIDDQKAQREALLNGSTTSSESGV